MTDVMNRLMANAALWAMRGQALKELGDIETRLNIIWNL